MKRYAIVGISNRGINSYIQPMVKTFANHLKIVAMLDADAGRFDVARKQVPQLHDVPTFMPDAFDRMIEQTKPDAVIVTTRDNLHEHYVLAALKRNVNVIVEKPVTSDCAQAQRVLDAESASDATVTVTHNMRFNPNHQSLKGLIRDGRIGRVTQVDFNYFVDTHHGASYFKRWNRQREQSGGLTIHKSSHHFDLVNWLIDQEPQQVFAYSALNYYGPDAETNPSRRDGRHCGDCAEREACAYEMRWSPNRTGAAHDDNAESHVAALRTQSYTHYRPDQCIFDSEIDIEDTYAVAVRYEGGVMMSYSENFSAPYEGYRLAINGTRGRLEINSSNSRGTFETSRPTIVYYPLFDGARETIEPLSRTGGHGGADPVMLEELFLGPPHDARWVNLGTARAGAMAVALGEAVWRSGKDNRPYNISELLDVSHQPTSHPTDAQALL